MGSPFLAWWLLGYGLKEVLAPTRFKPIDVNDPSFPTLESYRAILERFPLYAEPGWHGGYQGDPALGYFGDGRSDENGQRTLGNFILVYAYLATRPGYDPTVSGVPQVTLKEHALAALRTMVRTHVTGDLKCTDGRPWGNHWQSAWWTSRMLGGATLLWDALTEEEKDRIQRLVVHEADRHVGLPPRVNEYGDTKSEENAWDSEVLAWALNLYPDHPHAPAWREAFVRLCLNTLSVEADLLHEFRQPPLPATPPEELARRLEGTFVSPFSELAMRRDGKRFVSWCWKSHGGPATGLFCSDEGEDMLEWDHNLCGNILLEGAARHVAVVAHREETFEGGFSTTGLMEHGRLKGEPSPYRLVVVDDNVPTASIEEKGHPLFTTPHPIASLQGLTDLDSIVEAGPAWKVLARNARGGPSLLEARIGEGAFLLSMTNMEERCVQGDATARALMENLLAYVGARERRCGYLRGQQSHLRQALETLGVPLRPLDPRRLDLTAVDVLFIDRSAQDVLPLYPQILAFVRRGGMVVHSIVQDEGWEPDAIAEGRPAAVQQFLSWTALPDGRTAVLIGLWRAAGEVVVSSLDLLDWRVANDIFNGKRRRIWSGDARRPHVLLMGLDGKGEEIPLRTSWLNVEGDIGLAAWAPEAHFRILDIPERRAPARSLCYAQVQMVLENLPRRFAPGETIARSLFLFRTRMSPEETKAMASSLEEPRWDEEGVTLRLQGADGRRYSLVANFADGLTTKVLGP